MHLNLFLELLKEQILRQAEIKYNTKGYINPIEKLIIESLMKGICVFLYTPQKISNSEKICVYKKESDF